MKLSPTTIHFLQINRPACLAGLSGLIAVVALAILFAMQDEGVKSTADSDTLARVQLVSLPDARSSGLVPPIFIKRIDTDLSTLPAAKGKQAFIRMILPLVARENDRIRGLRQKLDKGSAPASLFTEYKAKASDMNALRRRLDIIPASLVLPQAALESGWGTSRFALEGNNLFGMRTYAKDSDGIAPASASGFKVMRFN
jgi:hypothetical protein